MAAKQKAPRKKVVKRELKYPRGYRAFEVASFLAQLDDLHRRIRIDTRGLTPTELEWQPHLGMNTVGMLLAHIAIVEVFWYNRVLERRKPFNTRASLGIGSDDDGIPLKPKGRHPGALRGRRLSYYLKLLARARFHRRALAKTLGAGDLDARFAGTRPDGTIVDVEKRWVLYHVVEHTAGHYYQINTLRRLYALEKGRVPRQT